MGKLGETFLVPSGEQELREIVSEAGNYELREEIKQSYRRMKFARRREKPAIIEKMTADFDKMIDIANVRQGINDFPSKGLRSEVQSDEGSILLSMSGLSKDEITFLPPHIFEKVEARIKIHYYYPIDKFEYVLTYDGQELPMKKALYKIQDEFEVACLGRYYENIDIRLGNKKETQKKYGSGGTTQQ